MLGMLPGRAARRVESPPDTELVVRGVTIDRARLAEYDRVCGFRLSDTLPATYPHVLGYPLALSLISSPEFPFQAVGLVHVANRVTTHRPIDAGEALDLAVRAEDLRPHERGRQIDVVTVATVGGEEVWRGVATYLHRSTAAQPAGPRRVDDDKPSPPIAGATWRVPTRVGVDYARVSGDHNPIHTSRIGARLLGFPRPIAHGMWSKARCLAAQEGRLPDAYTVDVAFKRPILLPATVAFSATPGERFALHHPKTGAPHLVGTLDSRPAGTSRQVQELA